MSTERWTTKDALEAHFGAYRLVIMGTDIRGYFSRDEADQAASNVNKHRGKDVARVQDKSEKLPEANEFRNDYA